MLVERSTGKHCPTPAPRACADASMSRVCSAPRSPIALRSDTSPSEMVTSLLVQPEMSAPDSQPCLLIGRTGANRALRPLDPGERTTETTGRADPDRRARHQDADSSHLVISITRINMAEPADLPVRRGRRCPTCAKSTFRSLHLKPRVPSASSPPELPNGLLPRQLSDSAHRDGALQFSETLKGRCVVGARGGLSLTASS